MTASRLEPGTAPENNYSLTCEEAEELPKFWEALQKARGAPFMDLAIRRFGYAAERHRLEDRFIDIMIAAEALFMTEEGKKRTSRDTRSRLSRRFAEFVENDIASRRARRRHIEKAYDVRSDVVHSLPQDPERLKLPVEGRVPFDRFVQVTEDQVRIALRKAIKDGPFSTTQLADWDSVIFG
jgi:hypothetical protein